jgi:hypothetical protein
MSDTPVYWSQPNQQVVRNGEPVGIVTDDPDPQESRATSKRGKRAKDTDDDAAGAEQEQS